MSTDTSSPDQTAGVRTVKSADRTVVILEHLSGVTEPQTLRELCDALEIPRASLYALLVTLQRRGWVENDGSKYRLGLRALRAGAAYLEADQLVALVSPVIDELNAEFGETVHLGRLDEGEILYLTTKPSLHSLSVVVRPGRRVPAWCTGLGKAILAQHPWDEVDRLLPSRLTGRTDKSITSRSVLRRDLEETRQRGYAIDMEESLEGIRCFAVPVGVRRPPTDAISFSVPLNRLDEAREQALVAALTRAGDLLRGS